jgi:LmbE family N-acetylglucosaminyl deacetylase
MSSEPHRSVLVVAPHPDDEVIGCGGALLRHLEHGDELHWLIVTDMHASPDYPAERRAARAAEIEAVSSALGFSSTTQLAFPPAGLDAIARSELVRAVADAIQRVRPQIVYAPFGGDAHSDHDATFGAVAAATKWFRADFVEQVLCYETLSETDAAPVPLTPPFTPNVFVDIAPWIDRKIEIAETYAGEFAPFPFPRSAEAIRALAAVRGAAAGFSAAESFMLIRSRIA